MVGTTALALKNHTRMEQFKSNECSLANSHPKKKIKFFSVVSLLQMVRNKNLCLLSTFYVQLELLSCVGLY